LEELMAIDIKSEVSNILGKNFKILEICDLIEMVGKTDSSVLVQGESGTGKELIANAIHAQSPRAKNPFIKINCNALSENFLENEIFTPNKCGSLTGSCDSLKGEFELASGGTILLDKISNMSLTNQAKLLKVLQNGEIVPEGFSIPIKVDVRIISTTTVILKKAVQQGAFLEDLFIRLGVITIFLPPLRERKEDIPLLVKNFIKFENFETKRHIKGISSKAMDALMEYEWPGNVGELKNAIEHAVIIENSDSIKLQSLPHHIFNNSSDNSFPNTEDFNLKRRLTTYERQLILRALIKADWVKSRAAQLLGIDKRNLGYFIRKHHILNS
jgi:transcriptional regulator with PAS, ATPase and Fis domain